MVEKRHHPVNGPTGEAEVFESPTFEPEAEVPAPTPRVAGSPQALPFEVFLPQMPAVHLAADTGLVPFNRFAMDMTDKRYIGPTGEKLRTQMRHMVMLMPKGPKEPPYRVVTINGYGFKIPRGVPDYVPRDIYLQLVQAEEVRPQRPEDYKLIQQADPMVAKNQDVSVFQHPAMYGEENAVTTTHSNTY